MIKAVCFDLDGTLLPLDVDSFCKYYFGILAKKMETRGYEPKALVGGIMAGTEAMYKNDGRATNEEVFWNTFCGIFGEQAREDMPYFEEFYVQEFDKARAACEFDPAAAPTVRTCKEMGLRICIATNPLFPEIATRKRLSWTGLSTDEVEFYTTYENCSTCKPNPAYFLDVAARLGVDPAECLMVGNDALEDMAAEKVGMKVFLLVNDYLLNRTGADIEQYPHGGFDELLQYVAELRKA